MIPSKIYSFFNPHCSHFLASLPAGGLIGTGPCLTSSQFVLSAVPPLSWKLFIIAFLVSSSAFVNRFWKNSFSVLSPLTLASSAIVLGGSESRIVLVTRSQFLRACGSVDPAFGAGVETEEELARATGQHVSEIYEHQVCKTYDLEHLQ